MKPEKCKKGYNEFQGRCIKIERNEGYFKNFFNKRTITILIISLLIIIVVGGIILI